MVAEKPSANEELHVSGPGAFSFSGAREVVSTLSSLQLDSAPKQRALVSSLTVFERQLSSLQSLHRVQTSLALDFGLDGAIPEGCTDTLGAQNAGGGILQLVLDPHAVAAALPDVFSVTDNLLDREHVQALAWQANCPQEAVRKELRAFQKAVNDRLGLAAKRVKSQGQGTPAAAPKGVDVRSNPPLPNSASRSSDASRGNGSSLTPSSYMQQHSLQAWEADERVYCLDEAEEMARGAQLAKLSTLLIPETGGICGSPVSVVGVFQQQMSCRTDWRVRRALLEAMGRTAVDVLWRLLQNSRVLDSLYNWLQEALADQQATMVKLMLDCMSCLPMRRDLLKGSRLEAALEALAGGGAGQRSGGGATAADDAGSNVSMRRRYGAVAAAVLAEWRRDPDAATILRRAGAVVDSPAAGRSSAAGVGSSAASALAPGSRLLGTAAAQEGIRKRGMQAQRSQGDARGTPRPRVQDAGGPGEGASGGALGGVRRAALTPAAAAAATKLSVDMTAKLGEKGPVDTDVVAGFRSRFGDGSVRRSQLARPARATATPATGGSAAPAAAPAVSFGAWDAVAGAAAAPAAADLHPATSTPPGAATAAARVHAVPIAAMEVEVDAEAVAHLRAERSAQRQAAALVAVQAEARRQAEVVAAEQRYLERLKSYQATRARRLADESRQRHPEDVWQAMQAMRENVPWVGAPPELLLPEDHTPVGTGQESVEGLERAHARQQVTKVSYASKELVPESPAEPTGQQHTQGVSAAPRSFPWHPSLDAEDGPMDWWRQNLILWEAGVRLPEYVLPPALLHKYLELELHLLPPQYAIPAAPTPVMSRQQLQQPQLAAQQVHQTRQQSPQQHQAQQPMQQGPAQQKSPPQELQQQPGMAQDMPRITPAAGAVASERSQVAMPPASGDTRLQHTVAAKAQHQHHKAPQLLQVPQLQQPLQLLQPEHTVQQQFLSQPQVVMALTVMPQMGQASSAMPLPLLTLPPPPLLQPQQQLQPQQLQPPTTLLLPQQLLPQRQPVYDHDQHQQQQVYGNIGSRPAGGAAGGQGGQQQPFEYGYANGHPMPQPLAPSYSDRNDPYSRAGGNNSAQPHVKQSQYQQQQHGGNSQHQQPAYHQQEQPQYQQHFEPQPRHGHGQSVPQSSQNTRHYEPGGVGDSGGTGRYGGPAYGGGGHAPYQQQEQQQQQQSSASWRHEAYQQPWDYGGRR